jgi:hypothetical protein
MHISKALALGAIRLAAHATAQSNNPGDDACARAARAQLEASENVDPDREGDIIADALFDAQLAFECIKSVPLDSQAAITMMELAKEYVPYQSSLAWLKKPFESYQGPSIDVLARIDQVIQNLRDDKYANHYELELDLIAIEHGTHEGHFSLPKPLSGLFLWQLPETIVSVSRDGKELPRVYASSDITDKVENASPIVEIEGKPIVEYMRRYLEENTGRTGLVEPHAEWNFLMADSASQFGDFGSDTAISTSWPGFQATTIYNGQSIKGRFANGTDFEWRYMAGSKVNMAKEKLTTSRAVSSRLIVVDDSLTAAFGTKSQVKTALKRFPLTNVTAVPFPNFPQDPDVIQENFANGGVVSGYLLEDASVAVLSLPEFISIGDDISSSPRTFSEAVLEFIITAKNANMKKIVIDISGNGGGFTFLAYDIFQQFFPQTKPTALFRSPALSSMPALNTYVGRLIEIGDIPPSHSAVQLSLNMMTRPDGTNWRRYSDFFGPFDINDGKFTAAAKFQTSRAAISDQLGFRQPSYSYEQPWAAEDIILLSNGLCHSTCAIFANLMKLNGGVKSVVVGGLPTDGPMQTVSGTRGCSVQTWGLMDTFSSGLQEERPATLRRLGITEDDVATLPTPLSNATWLGADAAAYNALDIVNPDNEDAPRQFVYEGANCRLFYTPDMIRDVTQLWRAAAKYADGDESMCVSGSVDAPGSGANETFTESPGFTYDQAWSQATTSGSFRDGKENNGQGEAEGGEDESAASKSAVGVAGLLGVLILMFCF